MIEREEIIVLLKADIQHKQKHRLQPSTTLESISCVRFSVFLRRFQLSSRERTLISQEIPQSLKLILTDLPKNVPSICHVDFFWCWKCQWRDTLTRAGYQYRLALSINITACTSSSDLSETFDEFIFLFTCCALSVEIYHRGPWGTWLFWLVQEQEIVISELTIFWERLFFLWPNNSLASERHWWRDLGLGETEKGSYNVTDWCYFYVANHAFLNCYEVTSLLFVTSLVMFSQLLVTLLPWIILMVLFPMLFALLLLVILLCFCVATKRSRSCLHMLSLNFVFMSVSPHTRWLCECLV